MKVFLLWAGPPCDGPGIKGCRPGTPFEDGAWDGVCGNMGVCRSVNICVRGERTASEERDDCCCEISWIGEVSSLTGVPKIASKSVRNMLINGAGMLRVGAKTMPTGQQVR